MVLDNKMDYMWRLKEMPKGNSLNVAINSLILPLKAEQYYELWPYSGYR
jgi:hypothetical protein